MHHQRCIGRRTFPRINETALLRARIASRTRPDRALALQASKSLRYGRQKRNSTDTCEVQLLSGDTAVLSLSALILEDEAMIALDLGETLSGLGFSDLGYASNTAEATAALADRRWSVILIDIGLGERGDVSLFAAHLREVGVPFIFCTGYYAPPFGFETVPFVSKPHTVGDLVAALAVAGVMPPVTELVHT